MAGVHPERFSPKALARVVGILSLVGIVTGAFDIGYVRSALIVAGNAAATAQNIAAHETLFRLGFTAHIVLLLCNIPAEVIGFILFRRVNVVIAAIAMSCGLIGTAIEGIDMLNAYVPLKLAEESGALGIFSTGQLQALSYLSLQLQDTGLLISFVFYGLDEMATGFNIFRSGFLPRILGILLALAGLSYFADGFISFVSPSLQARLLPYLLFPCLPGEGSIALWLAIVGLNVEKWRRWVVDPQVANWIP
ncbi:DUF4386 domain-containing protein [Dyella mobilis]|uniref:DUF4386 domain-containing protein n=1 Tax=Dyella mobilis TaxID=1849582 RepID=A0ABS2KB28_9GAMM|nr:DUF4386 domain-containing protein [Dyella mobilis]MBM7128366.1 DUF4386 domain-containing protein [Dyella mobilis]GLQ99670.1 hypothetical protein GCM10007863_40900 [Dyella mobilis]